MGPYTAEDYLALPEGERVELLRGRLMVMSPAPTPRHQHVGTYLWKFFDSLAITHGGVAFVSPIDVVLLDRTIAQPDVAYLRAGREGLVGDRILGPPDLLVEVASPSTANRDRVEKLSLYAEAGVREYWIVNPKSHVMEFHVSDGPTYRITAASEGGYQSPQYDEVQLDLTTFWQEVEQRLPPGA